MVNVDEVIATLEKEQGIKLNEEQLDVAKAFGLFFNAMCKPNQEQSHEQKEKALWKTN